MRTVFGLPSVHSCNDEVWIRLVLLAGHGASCSFAFQRLRERGFPGVCRLPRIQSSRDGLFGHKLLTLVQPKVGERATK
jgi:hypothetical protein